MGRRRLGGVLSCLAMLALAGCGPTADRPSAPPVTKSAEAVRSAPLQKLAEPRGAPTTDPPWFVDVTEQSGIRFQHDPGPVDSRRYFMPQIVGSGVALFDHDGDGRLDVYLVQNGGPHGQRNALYKQTEEGHFVDVSSTSGLDVAGHGMGVAVGDVNNDGLLDVVVTEFGGLRLFVNVGEGRFQERADAGVASHLWGTSACFIDYDRDGWLDLAVANYVDYDPAWPCEGADGARDYCHPRVFQGTTAKLFRNLTGDLSAATRADRDDSPSAQASRPTSANKLVRFMDVTVSSGLGRSPGPGLGIAAADFDGDGWPDLLVANDAHPNHLWINQRDGTFLEEAVSRGIAYDAVGRSLANMGIALGDLSGSGFFDVFITHLPEETHTVWRQESPGVFVDRTSTTGVLNVQWRGTGFGTALADFNHDGALDLVIANGRVVRAAERRGLNHWAAYAERNQLLAGTMPGQLRDISASTPDLCGEPNVARALATGDLDGDGDLDLVVTTVGGRARILRNVAARSTESGGSVAGGWLRIRVWDESLHRDAYGAEVVVNAAGTRRVGWVNPGQGYLTSHEAWAHFGIGSAPSYDSIEVLWPDGVRERYPGGAANQSLTLRRGEGEPWKRD